MVISYTLHLSHTQGYKNFWIIKITLKIKKEQQSPGPGLSHLSWAVAFWWAETPWFLKPLRVKPVSQAGTRSPSLPAISASVLAVTLKRLVAFQVPWRLALRSLWTVPFALTPARYCHCTPELLQPPPSCPSWLVPPLSRPLMDTSARCTSLKLHTAPAPAQEYHRASCSATEWNLNIVTWHHHASST